MDFDYDFGTITLQQSRRKLVWTLIEKGGSIQGTAGEIKETWWVVK